MTHLLTIIIFSCSCQHAAVNFSQMDTFSFLPNSPAIMRQPPPTQKGNVTEKDIMQCLANKHQAGVTIATVFDLTRIFPDEVSYDRVIYFQLKSCSINWIARYICFINKTIIFLFTDFSYPFFSLFLSVSSYALGLYSHCFRSLCFFLAAHIIEVNRTNGLCSILLMLKCMILVLLNPQRRALHGQRRGQGSCLGPCFSKVPRTFRARGASCQAAIRSFWKADLLTCF